MGTIIVSGTFSYSRSILLLASGFVWLWICKSHTNPAILGMGWCNTNVSWAFSYFHIIYDLLIRIFNLINVNLLCKYYIWDRDPSPIPVASRAPRRSRAFVNARCTWFPCYYSLCRRITLRRLISREYIYPVRTGFRGWTLHSDLYKFELPWYSCS